MFLLAIAALLAILVALFVGREGQAGRLLVVLGCLGAALLSLVTPPRRGPLPGEPTLHREDGFLGAGACVECHPSQSHSFARTYHRTMTRRFADLAAHERPRLPARLETRGRTFELAPHVGDPTRLVLQGPSLHRVAEALASLAPELPSEAHADVSKTTALADAIFFDAPLERHDVVLVTGSHHYLAFWVEGGEEEELRQLPFVWLLDEQEWVPREEAFLAPPGSLPHIARWNGSCVQCHAVAGMPGERDGRFQTQVADLGISCEACHGPGREHAESMRNPLKRALARHFESGDPSGTKEAEPASSHPRPGHTRSYRALNPSRWSPAQASARCGQCHAYFAPSDPERWWSRGFLGEANLAPGELPNLPGRILLRPGDTVGAAQVGLSRSLESIFWPDGSVIVGGREYSALIESACYRGGSGSRQLGCLHCHSMHDAEPNDQLKPNWLASCATCHGDIAQASVQHSGHGVEVTCADCHMPKTSYALLSAIASHRITIPTPLASSPPSACVLCHTSERPSWLENGYRALYSRRPLAPASPDDPGLPRPAASVPTEAAASLEGAAGTLGEEERALGLELAVQGDAVTRALLASALARPGSLDLTGPDYAKALLGALEDDPYPAVRRIASRALRRIGALEREPSRRTRKHLVPAPSHELLETLSRRRDDRPITISE